MDTKDRSLSERSLMLLVVLHENFASIKVCGYFNSFKYNFFAAFTCKKTNIDNNNNNKTNSINPEWVQIANNAFN